MLFFIKTLKFPIAVFSLLALLVAGCGKDDPTSPHEDHFEPEGLVIIDSGVRFFKYFQGRIDAADGRKDKLEVSVGLGPHWQIRFLDDHGDEIDPPSDPDDKFGWRIADPTVVEVFQDPEDVGKFAFHLRGLKAGSTTLELQVLHVDHVDFRTIPIPVQVNP